MSTGTEFTSDVGKIIQEDYSTSVIWTRAEIFDLLKSALRHSGGRTLGRDYLVGGDIDVGTNLYSGTTVGLPADFLQGYFVVINNRYEIDIEDFRNLELYSGLTNPMTKEVTGVSNIKAVVEMYDSGVQCYRFVPKLSSIPNTGVSEFTTTSSDEWTSLSTAEWITSSFETDVVEIWCKVDFETPTVIENEISLSQWFLTGSKFRVISDAFMMDTPVQDVEKGAIFKGLADILDDHLRRLFVRKEGI